MDHICLSSNQLIKLNKEDVMKIILDFVTNSSESDYYDCYDCDCDCDYDCYDCDSDCQDCDDCDCDCDYDCDCYDYDDPTDCWVPDGGPAPWDSCEADPDICCGYDH